jgi:hypothetical protein
VHIPMFQLHKIFFLLSFKYAWDIPVSWEVLESLFLAQSWTSSIVLKLTLDWFWVQISEKKCTVGHNSFFDQYGNLVGNNDPSSNPGINIQACEVIFLFFYFNSTEKSKHISVNQKNLNRSNHFKPIPRRKYFSPNLVIKYYFIQITWKSVNLQLDRNLQLMGFFENFGNFCNS